MTDVPMTLLFSLSMYCVLLMLHSSTRQLPIWAGIFIGAGLLSRYTMALIFPVLITYAALHPSFRPLRWQLGIAVVVSALVFAPWLIYAGQSDLLIVHAEKVISYAGVATQTNFGEKALPETLLARLPSSLGVYNLPLLFLGVVQMARRRSPSDLALFWWIIPLFAVVVATLPIDRYFMPAFPALALVMAVGLRSVPGAGGKAVLLALLFCAQGFWLGSVQGAVRLLHH